MTGETQDALALLQLLAIARGDMATGRVEPLEGLKERIRARAAMVVPPEAD